MLRLSKVAPGAGERTLNEMEISAQCAQCAARAGLVASCLAPGQTVADVPWELRAATLGCQPGPQRDPEYSTVTCPVADEMAATVQSIQERLATQAVANATE